MFILPALSSTSLAVLLMLGACGTVAQPDAPAQRLAAVEVPAGTTPEPQRGQPGKDVMWVPSSDEVTQQMLGMAAVTADDLVVDLGSGDGKIVIAAARDHGARARGLEYNPELVALSKQRARQAGVADRVAFYQADIFKADFSDATVVTLYLLPGLNLRLRETLMAMNPGTRVVSNSFDMGTWEPDARAQLGETLVFFWVVPANVSGHWTLQVPGLEGAPQALRLSQHFQKPAGEVHFGPASAEVLLPRLQGNSLSFSVLDSGGSRWAFEGTVGGSRLHGQVRRDGGPAQPFEARRSLPAPPIGGLRPTAHELRMMGEPF